MADDDRRVDGGPDEEEMSVVEEWVFDALDLVCDPYNVARMVAILDEAIEARGAVGDAGDRVAAEFSEVSAPALYTVLWWLASQRAAAGERALKELAFHADLRSRLARASEAAGAETVEDLDEATFARVLAETAADAGFSTDVAWSIFKNGPDASAAF